MCITMLINEVVTLTTEITPLGASRISWGEIGIPLGVRFIFSMLQVIGAGSRIPFQRITEPRCPPPPG